MIERRAISTAPAATASGSQPNGITFSAAVYAYGRLLVLDWLTTRAKSMLCTSARHHQEIVMSGASGKCAVSPGSRLALTLHLQALCRGLTSQYRGAQKPPGRRSRS